MRVCGADVTGAGAARLRGVGVCCAARAQGEGDDSEERRGVKTAHIACSFVSSNSGSSGCVPVGTRGAREKKRRTRGWEGDGYVVKPSKGARGLVLCSSAGRSDSGGGGTSHQVHTKNDFSLGGSRIS
jgi:hypothetical protein